MSTKSNKQVVLVSKNEDFYKAVRRALNFCLGVGISRVVTCERLIACSKNKNVCIIIDGILEQNIEKYSIFLRRSMWLNPIINITSHQKEIRFADSGLYYVIIPFCLKDLLDKVYYSEPITREQNIMFLISWLSKESHDIRNILNNTQGENECIKLIDQVFKFLNVPLKVPQNIISEKEEVVKMLVDLPTDKNIIADKLMTLFHNLHNVICRR